MELPSGLTDRPLRLDDAPRLASLLTAVEDVDQIGENYGPEDVVEELSAPDVELATRSTAVLDGPDPDAAVVAYQVLHHRTDPDGLRVEVEGAVAPAHRDRGLGTALLNRAAAHAVAVGADRLVLQVEDRNEAAIGLAVAAGMSRARQWIDLARDLTEPIVPVTCAPGYALVELGVPYDPSRWDEPLRAARNASFAQHWGSTPESAADFAAHRTGSRTFRPACSAAVLPVGEPDLVAAFLLAFEWDADTARTGHRDLYVMTVGTRAEHRGRGLGRALLTHALTVAARDGYATSSLDVDTQNATGALGLYTGVGYRERRRSTTWVAAVPAAAGVDRIGHAGSP